jgi:urease accessory protein
MSTLRATSFARARFVTETPIDFVVLGAEDRHLRRKLLKLQQGADLLVDLAAAVHLEDRDCLVLDDGRLVEVVASSEDLLEVTAPTHMQLMQLAWHIGNRHLEAQIEMERILIRPDHVIGSMLAHLGASIRSVRETFSPVHGAYHSHGGDAHSHDH